MRPFLDYGAALKELLARLRDAAPAARIGVLVSRRSRGDWLERARAVGAEVLVTSSDGIVIRIDPSTISRQKRDATGVKVMNLSDGAAISAFATCSKAASAGPATG